MKIEKMTAKQFAENHPREIGYFINKYISEISEMKLNPIDLEKQYSKTELKQIAAILGTAARTVISINRNKENIKSEKIKCYRLDLDNYGQPSGQIIEDYMTREQINKTPYTFTSYKQALTRALD